MSLVHLVSLVRLVHLVPLVSLYFLDNLVRLALPLFSQLYDVEIYLCGGFCDFIAFICPKNVILKGFC